MRRASSTSALRCHNPLDRHRALDCVHDAAELSEDPIACRVNYAAAVLLDHGEYDGLMPLGLRTVLASSAPMRALYPAMSAARIAANLREILVFSGPSVIYPYLAACVEQY
jgi:hypothetical protein